MDEHFNSVRSIPEGLAPSMAPRAPSSGLSDLRRSGAVTELLFLYACATVEPTQLRPIAEELGVTVQAVSHSYRQLAHRGLAEVRDGHYLPTVKGVAWLHRSLGRVGEDVQGRLGRLSVVRSCRAVAVSRIRDGESVSLSLRDGILSATPGGVGPSKGVATRGGRQGALVDVGRLEGILPLMPAVVTIRTLTEADLRDPRLRDRLLRAIPPESPGLLAAHGLEAYHALRKVTTRPVTRFAVAASSQEASRIGVATTVLVLDSELPRFLSEFAGPLPPPLRVMPLGRDRSR
jgi:putative transcriptional regulator